MTDPRALSDLYARLFIARRDVKAVQTPDGAYHPDQVNTTTYAPWSRQNMLDHLSGKRTYGHYLLDTDNQCKLFAFDIDFDTKGMLPTRKYPDSEEGVQEWETSFTEQNPRLAWRTRSHPAREYMKFCMRNIAHILERAILDMEVIETAVAYTGNKGIHVYGFTGRMPASEVRALMNLALDSLTGLVAHRGKSFYKFEDVVEKSIFTVETFPKQDAISHEGGFGNLMRLPLGVNQKAPKDPTFFVDTAQPLGQLLPIADPVPMLTGIANSLVQQ